ncbi:recombinase family protein [Bradyrhizobium septentrionale]|uniref:recombinase family protein n=1 Tax=Bradyrhizobium septentrionale TaxID=1404411 RepID=UPI001CD24B91|nr:recombinase family protein [Bradyrhizobium septentrionale]UGY27445.1 recombinase family protein [Bradyrhizobium septentrionale]
MASQSIEAGFAMVKFIAYFRVSTERQGKSGLGLAAQRRKISEFVAGAGSLIAEFCDIQSGRDDSRVELQRAIQLAKRENAKIVIARLDRFSRRVSFIASILEQGIGLVCAEMPNATDFQLHIFAALAQEERRLISERTKAALAEAKRRGKILGLNGQYLAAKNRKAADDFASQLRAKLDTDLLRCSYSEIARHLNDAGITTVTGRSFYPQTVKNYLLRWAHLRTSIEPATDPNAS